MSWIPRIMLWLRAQTDGSLKSLVDLPHTHAGCHSACGEMCVAKCAWRNVPMKRIMKLHRDQDCPCCQGWWTIHTHSHTNTQLHTHTHTYTCTHIHTLMCSPRYTSTNRVHDLTMHISLSSSRARELSLSLAHPRNSARSAPPPPLPSGYTHAGSARLQTHAVMGAEPD